MKKIIIVAVILMGFCLTACSTEIPLEDPNTDVVAEYVADLLLRYESDTPIKLIYPESTPKATKSPGLEITPTPTPSQTAAVDVKPVETSKPDKPSASPTTTDKPSTNTGNNLTANTTPVKLDTIYGFPDIAVTLQNSKEYSSYPENATAYCITARKGYKLIIVTMSAQNNGKKNIDFDLGKKGITYYLYANEKWYSSLTTILDNDAQYLSTTVAPGKTNQFLIAFEVEEKSSVKEASLILLEKTNSCELKLD